MNLFQRKYFVCLVIFAFLFALNGPAFSMGKKKKFGENTVLCQKGHQNPAGTRFCITCGEEISPAKSAYYPDGHENPAGAKFCQTCGKKIVTPVKKKATGQLKCPDGHENPANAKFCQTCGKKLAETVPGMCPDGHVNPKGAAFCRVCGKKIPQEHKRRDSFYKRHDPRPDMTKDRGNMPTIISISFFLALGVAIAVAGNSASE